MKSLQTPRQLRFSAIDPCNQADKCTCGKAECPRARLLPFRDHISALYRLVRNRISDVYECSDFHPWESVLFPLMMAASISDVEADTGYVEDPMVFALCEPAIDYEIDRSEMASKYVAAATIFNFLWLAYEAAVSVTAPDEMRSLLDGRLGERGRLLLANRPEISAHFEGLTGLLKLSIHWCEAGGRFDDRLTRIRARFTENNFVLAAELCREFRNFLFHGEDELPDHPERGDAVVAQAGLYRFYTLGRLLLYLVQALAWVSNLPESRAEIEDDESAGGRPHDPREAFSNVQFANAR